MEIPKEICARIKAFIPCDSEMKSPTSELIRDQFVGHWFNANQLAELDDMNVSAARRRFELICQIIDEFKEEEAEEDEIKYKLRFFWILPELAIDYTRSVAPLLFITARRLLGTGSIVFRNFKYNRCVII